MKQVRSLFCMLICCAGFLSADAQVISTIAGTGSFGFSGDGSAATSAQLNGPQDVALDTFGNVYIADAANHRIRKITIATGVITTIAGTGTAGYSGDGGLATAAKLYAPIGISVSASGDVYIADNGNHCIRKVSAATGNISTVAGTPTLTGYSGDGGAATAARLYAPYDVTVDAANNLYIADVSNHCIRKVTASTGIISTVAGTGVGGFSGDGGAATAAKLFQPFCVAVDSSGNLYITDASNARIRKVTAATGVITTIAGSTAGYAGDGGPATSARFSTPYSIALDQSGNIYISDFLNQRIRKITVSTGVINTITGTGTAGFSGDGGLATAAQTRNAKGIFVDKVNNVYIADEQNHRVRFICNAATIPPAPTVSSPLTLCTGSTPGPLTAIGSGLKWYTTATGGTGSATAPVPSVATTGTTTYYVSQSSACGESPRAALVVNVINAPPAPVVSTPVVYCQYQTATPLVASGAPLNWYTAATGGTGTGTAPTPNTAFAGTFTYYVSQGTSGCESPRSALTVTVNPTPDPPTAVSVVYCVGATPVALSATGTNLKWYATAIGGTASATAPTPSAATEGSNTYYVSQSNSFGCESGRTAVRVEVNAKPKVSITSAIAPLFYVCKGSYLTLKALASPYGYSYQWQSGGVDISGATRDTFDAYTKGVYRVIVSNAPNCNDTATVVVDQDTSLISTGISPTDITICEGVNIKLYASGRRSSGYKYQWLKDGILMSDTTEYIVVGTKGSYELKVTNAQGCSVLSNASDVYTYPPVAKPVISRSGSRLSVPAVYTAYQWYRNSKLIPGATSFFYDLSFEGSYYVTVSDVNGCGNISDTVTSASLGVHPAHATALCRIFPNPVSDILYIQGTHAVAAALYDLSGRMLLTADKSGQIPMRQLPSGTYVLKVYDADNNLLGVERITKSNR